MFELDEVSAVTKPELYAALRAQLASLVEGERDFIANASNFSALLYHGLPDLSWAGFYLRRGDELVLGPFQGKPACIRIGMGRGVCGTAAAKGETIVVEDVFAFPGHIFCDAAARSEVVIPLLRDGMVIGVLDLDSASLARFDAEDAAGLEAMAEVFLAASDAPR
ncbi:MAG TPA: GAF domain-containing protein [Longimicrobiaceae bacterium]|nr:GAF domain-containing protein [Longimicrobiaceae bacterium]